MKTITITTIIIIITFKLFFCVAENTVKTIENKNNKTIEYINSIE